MLTERQWYVTTGTKRMRGGWQVNEGMIIYAATYDQAYRIARASCYLGEQIITLEAINHEHNSR